MKKAIVKTLSVVLVVILTLTSAPLSGFVGIELSEWLKVFSVDANASSMKSTATIQASGTCGPNAFWTLDTNGNMRISGTGAITSHPWWQERETYFIAWYPIYKYTINSLVIEVLSSSVNTPVFCALITSSLIL